MDSDRPSVLIVASGPWPPPDSGSALVVVVGETLPSLSRFSVASRASQTPPMRLRTGAIDWRRVSVPLGLAVSVWVAVVAPGTGTARPLETARANASTESD